MVVEQDTAPDDRLGADDDMPPHLCVRFDSDIITNDGATPQDDALSENDAPAKPDLRADGDIFADNGADRHVGR